MDAINAAVGGARRDECLLSSSALTCNVLQQFAKALLERISRSALTITNKSSLLHELSAICVHALLVAISSAENKHRNFVFSQSGFPTYLIEYFIGNTLAAPAASARM